MVTSLLRHRLGPLLHQSIAFLSAAVTLWLCSGVAMTTTSAPRTCPPHTCAVARHPNLWHGL